jgi:hypothetical protein
VFPTVWYLHEPLLLSAFFFGNFVLFILWQRVDLSISKVFLLSLFFFHPVRWNA